MMPPMGHHYHLRGRCDCNSRSPRRTSKALGKNWNHDRSIGDELAHLTSRVNELIPRIFTAVDTGTFNDAYAKQDKHFNDAYASQDGHFNEVLTKHAEHINTVLAKQDERIKRETDSTKNVLSWAKAQIDALVESNQKQAMTIAEDHVALNKLNQTVNTDNVWIKENTPTLVKHFNAVNDVERQLSCIRKALALSIPRFIRYQVNQIYRDGIRSVVVMRLSAPPLSVVTHGDAAWIYGGGQDPETYPNMSVALTIENVEYDIKDGHPIRITVREPLVDVSEGEQGVTLVVHPWRSSGLGTNRWDPNVPPRGSDREG